MEKSLSRDLAHSTILTSLQKLGVPDCSTSGSVTLNFWSMLTALKLLHIHMKGEGKRHTWDHIPGTQWKQDWAGHRVQSFSTPLLSASRNTQKMLKELSLPPISYIKAFSRDIGLNHCPSSWHLTPSLVHVRSIIYKGCLKNIKP